MKLRLLNCLLCASLGANVLLAYATLRPKGILATILLPGVARIGSPGNHEVSTETTQDLLRGGPRDPQTVLAVLPTLGLPPGVIEMGVVTAVSEKYNVEALARANEEGVRGAREKYEEADRLMAAEFAALLPAGAEKSASQSETTRRFHYGDLSREKITFVNETRARLEREKNARPTDAEIAVALQARLSPAEVDEYMKFHSRLAKSIQSHIAPLEIDLPTYEKLLAALADQPLATRGAVVSVDLLTSYHVVLGDEQFLKTMPRFDESVSSADAAYVHAGVSVAARVDNFIESHDLLGRLRSERSAERRRELAAAGRRSLIEKAGLSTPEQISRFDESGLGVTLQQYLRAPE